MQKKHKKAAGVKAKGLSLQMREQASAANREVLAMARRAAELTRRVWR